MNKTTRVTLAATAASALALTGCSGSSGDDTVNLRMVETLTNPVRQEILGELIDEFEADNPGVTVELVSPPNESALTTVQQMLQSGSGVDVLEVQDSTVGPFTANDWLYDMNANLADWDGRSEEHTSELQSLMRISYAVFCLKKKINRG